MFHSMDAQSEIARRQAFVSSGMQDTWLLSRFVSNLIHRLRDRLGKAASECPVSHGCQSPVQGHYAQS
jgi:hypothetical protein